LNPTSLGSRFEVQNSRFRNNFLKLTSLGSRSKMQYSRLKHPWIQFFSSSWILNLEPSPPSIQNLFSRSRILNLGSDGLGEGWEATKLQKPMQFLIPRKTWRSKSEMYAKYWKYRERWQKGGSCKGMCIYIYNYIIYIYLYLYNSNLTLHLSFQVSCFVSAAGWAWQKMQVMKLSIRSQFLVS
jgi:hypothetical protein